MNRTISIALLFLSLAAVARAQGVINICNATSANAVSVGTQGNWYSGTIGLEVWVLNTTVVPADVNAVAATNGLAAYSLLARDGFSLEGTLANRTATQGSFFLEDLWLNDVHPPGANVLLALAAWNTGAASWTAMLASADANTRAGVLAFIQRTADPLVGGMAPPLLDFDNAGRDLLMLPVPEPGAIPLAVLGAAVLWSFRRRR